MKLSPWSVHAPKNGLLVLLPRTDDDGGGGDTPPPAAASASLPHRHTCW